MHTVERSGKPGRWRAVCLRGVVVVHGSHRGHMRERFDAEGSGNLEPIAKQWGRGKKSFRRIQKWWNLSTAA